MIEKTYISQFDVKPDGTIAVRKTTDIIKNEQVIANTHWRCVLQVNDPEAESVLDEPFYLNLAQSVWNNFN